jgi:DNA invertase Pin-like site-specific DNA recombinase
MIYGYMRKSNEEGSNSSFDTQKHKIQGYCQIHNLKVDEYFEDICSGGLLLEQRQSGMLMSTKLKKGDTIICSTLDRYSRSHYGLVNDVEKFRRQKIKLVFTDLGDVISSDSLGSVFYQILSIMSEWYRKSLSEKQKVAQAKLKEQGKYQGGKITYGKDLGENGVLIDCEKQKREINLIMSLRTKGTKYKDIKAKLERYTGKRWHHSFIVKLVKRHEDNWYKFKEQNVIRRLKNLMINEVNICDI